MHYPRRPRTSASEEQALAARCARGDLAARDELVLRNLPLATWMAARWRRKCHVPMDDLVAEARLAMVRAARTFRPEESRFGSYVAFMMDRDLRLLALSGNRLVRVPIKTSHFALPEVLGPLDLRHPAVESGPSPEDRLAAEELRGIVRRVLVERSAAAVEMRFGLGGRAPRTLLEIGRALGVCRERARQLVEEALPVLRAELARRGRPLAAALGFVRRPAKIGRPRRRP